MKQETSKGSKVSDKIPKDKLKTGPADFPIVGIGASAGGLEAYRQFFLNMPANPGMAFVLISHLDPQHPSMLSDILSKSTSMAIVEARDGMRLSIDHVYVIPPNKKMFILRSSLYLLPPEEPRGRRMPIDFFMTSLAEDQGENAICVILSGTGSDGSFAIQSINEKNGIVMVQDPETAGFDGMPRSAIRTGLVDYVLPVEKMPEQLISFFNQFRPKSEKESLSTLQQILPILRSRTGIDFSQYKQGTIARRIEKRMSIHKIEDAVSYARYLQKDPAEGQALLKDLLICVTSFFREPQAFELLRVKALPQVIDTEKTFRIWVPGCATGEEPFSIAIILREYMEEKGHNFPVQIFATDINEHVIIQARTGLYPDNISADVSSERLKKFFTKEVSGYKVKANIREMVTFAVHNVIRDAPFRHLDLISCRNLMIYLNPEIQDQIMHLFHFSLKPNGILFLGSSESIGASHELFSVVDRKWKLFKAKFVDERHSSRFASQSVVARYHTANDLTEAQKKINTSEFYQKLIFKYFAPTCAIITEKGEILYTQGETGRYFTLPSGKPTNNILDMVERSLKPILSSAMFKASSKGEESSYPNVRVEMEDGLWTLTVLVRPIREAEIPEKLTMVIFKRQSEHQEALGKSKGTRLQKERIEELEREIAFTKESLQTTIEEMRASSEELQSANEELRSSNEELESSREELQSMNEELSTLNSELQAKLEQLTRAESDFKVLLDSTKIGIIFLDDHLRIKRFTEDAVQVINLLPTDIGRPFSDIARKFEYSKIYEDAQGVIDTLIPKEREIQTQTGNSFLLRMVPYRTVDNIIEGVVITFTSISELKQAIKNAARA